ncbi:hypothetical protein [Mycolicibacterium pyrenivorans]|uniref:hypothetical protein n=1 Tax=Mycolicibacterium pyrenivorans TaxID=187102 RepID=UPI0021F3B0C2|nr:hypothetical protein [Mycolicibacterium pyrenivorans]MCV7154895.1 hypothetical protein [Mycolicibacterium pyrenivorans]
MTLTTGLRADYDIAVDKPPRVVTFLGDDVSADSAPAFVRVRGRDLREVAQRAATAREQHPDVDVLVDIDVMIAPTAPAARELLASVTSCQSSDTLLYVGTPAGLAGLVSDLHALGIADGAVLLPLLPVVIELIEKVVLPHLNSLGVNRFGLHESQSA